MQFSKEIKSKILQGGIFLTLRQLLAALLSLISTLVIARVLGPGNYGIVATSIGIFYFLKWTSRLGLDAYLIRKPNLSKAEAEQVLSFYNTVGVLFCIILWLASPVFGWWTGHNAVAQAMRWLVPVVWLDMIGATSISMLERELCFAQVGIIETLAQFANYLLSVPLVLMHWSYWGPVAGTVLEYVIFASLSQYFYRIAWRWRWNWQLLQPALRYGITFFSSNWITTLQSLTVPLFVSRLAGIEAAGIVGIAIRMVQQLELPRIVIRRMSISVMAKLMGDPDAIQRAVSRGMAYQALLMGTVGATAACLATWIIPTLFGEKWLFSAQVFPLLALTASVSTIFDLHTSTLYASGHNREVARLNGVYVGMLWLGTCLFIPLLGLWGYPIAELTALPSYLLIHHSLRKLYGSPDYWNAVWFILAAIPPLLGGIWLPLPLTFVPLIVSYGLLFSLNSNARQVVRELFSAARTRQYQSSEK